MEINYNNTVHIGDNIREMPDINTPISKQEIDNLTARIRNGAISKENMEYFISSLQAIVSSR